MPHIDDFFAGDDDPTESVSDWPTRHSSPSIGDFVQEAAEMRALVDNRRIHAPTYWGVVSDVPQHFLVPRESDPPLWAIRVKVMYISLDWMEI
jgi:hypothetical protein